MKKNVLRTVAASLVLSVGLCACSTNANEPESETTAESTSVESTTEVTSEENTTENTTEPANEDWRETTPYEGLELDGVKENHIVTTDYCYIESDKYVLFLDKDIELPGDFVNNLDAIIDEIEVETGLIACPETGFDYDVCDLSVYFDGVNPWEGANIGSRIPIFLLVDRENVGLIPCASESYAVFVLYELYSEDYWMNNYSRDEDWRRTEYMDYTTIAHELTHVVTLRYGDMTNILTEGIAEYMGRSVITRLADTCPSIGETNEMRYLYDNGIPAPVNADNAEEILIDDYNEVSHADRGAEYVTGRYFCQFLYEKFGDGFIADYLSVLDKYNYADVYGAYDESIVKEYVEALKETYGEDIITEFGDWCVSNNVLQNTEGVW